MENNKNREKKQWKTAMSKHRHAQTQPKKQKYADNKK